MKTLTTKQAIRLTIFTLLFLACLDGFSQTKYRNIPIVCEDAFKIEIWSLNEATNTWDWYDITETELEYAKGWYFNKEINIEVRQYEIIYFRFKVGSTALNCEQYTFLTLHGGHTKNKVKDRKDLRVQFVIDGEVHEMGIKIDKPNDK